MTVTPFVGAGKLYLGSGGDPITNPDFYCETTGNVLRDASSEYTEITECGGVSAIGSPDWELDVSMVQDMSQQSLLRYAFTNRATVTDFIFIPDGTDPGTVGPDHPAYTGNVLIRSFDIGGPTTGLATSQRTWKVQGDITEVTAPFTGP